MISRQQLRLNTSVTASRKIGVNSRQDRDVRQLCNHHSHGARLPISPQTAPSIEASDVSKRAMMTTSLYHCLSKLPEVMQLNMVTETLPHGGGSHSMNITLHKLAVELTNSNERHGFARAPAPNPRRLHRLGRNPFRDP